MSTSARCCVRLPTRFANPDRPQPAQATDARRRSDRLRSRAADRPRRAAGFWGGIHVRRNAPARSRSRRGGIVLFLIASRYLPGPAACSAITRGSPSSCHGLPMIAGPSRWPRPVSAARAGRMGDWILRWPGLGGAGPVFRPPPLQGSRQHFCRIERLWAVALSHSVQC